MRHRSKFSININTSILKKVTVVVHTTIVAAAFFLSAHTLVCWQQEPPPSLWSSNNVTSPIDLTGEPITLPFIPSSEFGKTHFIVGFPHAQFAHATPSSRTSSHYVYHAPEAYFAPDDDLTELLVAHINQEMNSIHAAIYMFTDPDIAQALINAHARGVHIELIVDPIFKSDRYSKIDLLKKAGITIFEYDPGYVTDTRSNIMHHKFIIFGYGTPELCVWTGSFNWTKSAKERNQENVMVVYDPIVAQRYHTQFECMKGGRCVGCGCKRK